jgi:hypothetical protein
VTNLLSFPHQVTRLVFDAGQPYEKFRSRYEAAVPPADPPWLGETSTVFASFAEPAIADYGADLDRQLGGIVQRARRRGRPVPGVLRVVL